MSTGHKVFSDGTLRRSGDSESGGDWGRASHGVTEKDISGESGDNVGVDDSLSPERRAEVLGG